MHRAETCLVDMSDGRMALTCTGVAAFSSCQSGHHTPIDHPSVRTHQSGVPWQCPLLMRRGNANKLWPSSHRKTGGPTWLLCNDNNLPRTFVGSVAQTGSTGLFMRDLLPKYMWLQTGAFNKQHKHLRHGVQHGEKKAHTQTKHGFLLLSRQRLEVAIVILLKTRTTQVSKFAARLKRTSKAPMTSCDRPECHGFVHCQRLWI